MEAARKNTTEKEHFKLPSIPETSRKEW